MKSLKLFKEVKKSIENINPSIFDKTILSNIYENGFVFAGHNKYMFKSDHFNIVIYKYRILVSDNSDKKIFEFIFDSKESFIFFFDRTVEILEKLFKKNIPQSLDVKKPIVKSEYSNLPFDLRKRISSYKTYSIENSKTGEKFTGSRGEIGNWLFVNHTNKTKEDFYNIRNNIDALISKGLVLYDFSIIAQSYKSKKNNSYELFHVSGSIITGSVLELSKKCDFDKSLVRKIVKGIIPQSKGWCSKKEDLNKITKINGKYFFNKNI